MTIPAFEEGRKYERKVQTLLETHSIAPVFRNVRIGQLCEFDAVVEDYPLLTFIEIKRYRTDFAPNMVRVAVRKLRKDCTLIVNDTDVYERQWIPYRNKRNEKERGEVTYFELLLNKLNIKPIEGWQFRMVLIIPDAVYIKVVESLMGYFMPKKSWLPRNIIEVEGIPLHVVREGAIPLVFG
uniref:Uncharacterized protein n=1 Tax=Candidatus Methanogaster sp. ANME-2c ERB4 TaxID=2759911 RepID=A0A7G9Y0C0_9EURY|nr:hypothetical protein CIDILJJO_00001 [Methanosarcinales archaeon ANME-2c ERB4]QNO42112.1 hypothetical protein INBEEEIC_00014 [Methanosarcinales archaeon ANME-2c ERB4]QNO42313.1 hypothetical protein OEDCDHIP_00030 [Methanosarcinales archaeon ANME-2c ERB4]QNO42478.1 hypothetical protein LBOOMNCC_00031 [Methanosarcinales archaeon ANME-2c ERB4]QNO42698.1 hypothetical protein AOABALHP_00001 [Methanosarcinales archaeon ANME-2c ERB4]